jgi:hypothetical protein
MIDPTVSLIISSSPQRSVEVRTTPQAAVGVASFARPGQECIHETHSRWTRPESGFGPTSSKAYTAADGLWVS